MPLHGLPGIHGSTWVRAEELKIDPQRPSFSVDRLIQDARRRLGRIIDAATGGDATDEKAVLKALVFGDRSGIGDDLRQRFNRSGVGHLLAISGLHVGIVAMLTFGVFRWLSSFCSPLLWRGSGRRLAAGATLFPVLAYGMLAGMSPSTQRAVIMVAVFLAALLLGRSRDTLNTLAVAALVILVIFPPALFSISFQLSFAAVLAIVVGIQKFKITRDTADRPARNAAKWLMGGSAGIRVGRCRHRAGGPVPFQPDLAGGYRRQPIAGPAGRVCGRTCGTGFRRGCLFFRISRRDRLLAGTRDHPCGVDGGGWFRGAFLCGASDRDAFPAGDRALLSCRLDSVEPAQINYRALDSGRRSDCGPW